MNPVLNCSEVEELMAAYVAGQSGRSREQAIAAHLLTCGSCRAWHDEVQGAWGLWQDADAADAADATPDIVTPVMARLQRPRTTLPMLPLRNSLLHYGVAASVAMILFSTGLFDRYSDGVLSLESGLEQLITSITTLIAGGF